MPDEKKRVSATVPVETYWKIYNHASRKDLTLTGATRDVLEYGAQIADHHLYDAAEVLTDAALTHMADIEETYFAREVVDYLNQHGYIIVRKPEGY